MLLAGSQERKGLEGDELYGSSSSQHTEYFHMNKTQIAKIVIIYMMLVMILLQHV